MTRVQQCLLIVCVSFFTFCGWTSVANSSLPNIENNLHSTVLVATKNVTPRLDETTHNMAPVPAPDITNPGMGTGIIMTDKGHIITNYHVVEKGNTISVWMYEDETMTEYDATIVGFDKLSDIAVIKIDLPKDYNFKKVEWGRSPDYGDDIYVIGHPQGMIWSVSKGVVSHPKRFVTSPWQTLIQSDALIMPGNSGGPLFDHHGDLVGINTLMILSRDPTAKTQAWAMSIHLDDVRWVYDRIIEYGRVRRPALNIEVDFDVENKLVKIKAGPDTALGKLGMKESYLLEIDGIEVKEYGDIFNYLRSKLDGDTAIIKVKELESGEVKSLTFKLADWEALQSNKEKDKVLEKEEELEIPHGIPSPK